jgi:hypothetical protein
MLVCGKYLQEGMNIVAVKQPSFIKTVDYAKLVDELYETKIADDDRQDVYIKKLIANVNICLLEKYSDKKTVGYLFQDFKGANLIKHNTVVLFIASKRSKTYLKCLSLALLALMTAAI